MTQNFNSICEFFSLFLEQNPQFKNKIFLVGGLVRDEFLNQHQNDLDIDIAVEINGGAQSLAQSLHDFLPQFTIAPFHVGKGYPIWKIKFKAPFRINKTEFDWINVEIDLADTQKEAFPDPQTRQRITSYGTFAQDMLRRDFTINMLAYDLTDKNWVDATGYAIQDLQSKIIRTNPDLNGQQILTEDPLRIIRALRFASVFKFQITEQTQKDLVQCAHRLEIISPERITSEWEKTIRRNAWPELLRLAIQLNLFHVFFPGVDEQKIPWQKMSLFRNNLYEQLLCFLSEQTSSVVTHFLSQLKMEHSLVKKILKAQTALLDLPHDFKSSRAWARQNKDILNELRLFDQTHPAFNWIDQAPIWNQPLIDGHQIQKLFSVQGPAIKKISDLSQELRDDYYLKHQADIKTEELILQIQSRINQVL